MFQPKGSRTVLKHISLMAIMLSSICTTVDAQTKKKTLTAPPENAFSAVIDSSQRVTYRNPVISGFNSDPSICRVGDDF
jgi:hypothetical protein